MAISTYTELKAAVANWLHRSDLTSQIADFITLAESRLNRNLQIRLMETEASLTCVVGSRYIALPSDFNTPICVWLESFQPRWKLTPTLPDQISVAPASGYPEFWCIDGSNLAFDKTAAGTYPITFRYFKWLTLSDSAPTNSLLTEYPDLYLFATLLEAAPYLRDDQRTAVWQERFDRAMTEVMNNETENRAVAPLRTDIAAQRQTRFNILRGY